MTLPISTVLLLLCAGTFGLVAVLIWFAFLRPVPVQQTTAVIKSKTYKPAGTYWQQQVGLKRGFRTATPISIAESYVLELHSDDLRVSGNFSIDPSSAEGFSLGERVVMDYQRRGLPLIGYKIMVLSVRPA